MSTFFKRLYHGSKVGRVALALPRAVYHIYRFRWMGEESFVRWRFKQVFGREPDLENPRGLNEKIQWLKLYDRSHLHTQCADKRSVRDFVAASVGEDALIPILFETADPADLTPSALPDTPFIIKTTHGSSGGVIVRDKSDVDWPSLRRELRKQLRTNYYYVTKEWPYKNIEPRVIVEKLLQREDGTVPFDYKFHCFHGEPQLVQVDLDRFTNHRRNFYSPQWTPLPLTWSDWADGQPLWPAGDHVPRPSRLRDMLEIAAKLSKPFAYARIDLYEVDGRPYFGEMTFHHGSGTEIITPTEWDIRLGDLLRLPEVPRPEARAA